MLLAGDLYRFSPPQCLEILIAVPQMNDLYRPFDSDAQPIFLHRTADRHPVIIVQRNEQQWGGILVDFLAPGLHGYPSLFNPSVDSAITYVEHSGIHFPILRPRFLLFQRVFLVNSLLDETQRTQAMAEVQVLLDLAVREVTLESGRFSPHQARLLLPMVVGLIELAQEQGIHVTRDHLKMWIFLGVELTTTNIVLDLAD
jgi:hypothetical protein